MQTASTLTQNIQTSRETLRALQNSINEQLKTSLEEVNSIGARIADLNAQIGNIESVKGNNANDLRDQRD